MFHSGRDGGACANIDCKTVLGPWIKFTSAETLEKTLHYLGGTDEQLAEHRNQMSRCGQGTSHIRLHAEPEESATDRLEQTVIFQLFWYLPRCPIWPVMQAFLVLSRTCNAFAPNDTHHKWLLSQQRVNGWRASRGCRAGKRWRSCGQRAAAIAPQQNAVTQDDTSVAEQTQIIRHERQQRAADGERASDSEVHWRSSRASFAPFSIQRVIFFLVFARRSVSDSSSIAGPGSRAEIH